MYRPEPYGGLTGKRADALRQEADAVRSKQRENSRRVDDEHADQLLYNYIRENQFPPRHPHGERQQDDLHEALQEQTHRQWWGVTASEASRDLVLPAGRIKESFHRLAVSEGIVSNELSSKRETAYLIAKNIDPVEQEFNEAAGLRIQPAHRSAYSLYQKATEELADGEEITDREAYDYISEHLINSKNELQAFETFRRYLSEVRRKLGENKHTPRAGRKRYSVRTAEEF